MSDLLLMRGSPLRQLLSTSGLVACYLPWLQIAQGATGQTLLDYSGQGNHAQLGSTTGVDANDPTWFSNGIRSDGTQYTMNGPQFSIQAGGSIGLVYTPYYPFYNYQGVFDFTNEGNQWESWIDKTGTIKFRIPNSDSIPQYSLTNDSPFYAVFTATNGGNSQIYINGVLQSSVAIPYWVNCPGPLSFFCSNENNMHGKGILHYGEVFNRVLSAPEVALRFSCLNKVFTQRYVCMGYEEKYKTRVYLEKGDCHQGVIRGGNCWYLIGTSAIYKYDNDWNLLASNTQPHTDINESTNHLGSGCFYENKIYLPSEEYPNDPYDNQWITVWDATDLSFVSKHDISSQAIEISGIWVSPQDGDNGVVYTTSYQSPNEILEYDLGNFSYINKVPLVRSDLLSYCQGLYEKDGYLYISHGADSISKITKDGWIQGTKVFDMSETEGEVTATSMEGITWDEQSNEFVVVIKHTEDSKYYLHWLEAI